MLNIESVVNTAAGAGVMAAERPAISRKAPRCYTIGLGGVRVCADGSGECGFYHIEKCEIYQRMIAEKNA